MSELEELPSWAGRSTEEVQLPPKPPEDAEVAAPEEIEAPTLPQADEPPDQDAAIAAPAVAAATATAATTAAAQAAPSDPPPTLATDPAPTEIGPAPATVAPRRRSRLATVLLALLGVAVLGGAAAAGYFFASSQDSDETAATGDTAATEEAAEDVASPTATEDSTTDGAAGGEATATDDGSGETATDAGADATTDAGGDDATGDTSADEDGSQTVTVEVDEDGEGTDGDAGTDADADAGDGAEPMNDGNRQAFFRGGVVYLTGSVPSEEIGQLIVERAAAVVGPDNVVNDYTIDPSTTIQPGESAPLFVEDVILFEFNSVEVATPFLPILDLGTLLLRQNPQASVTVVTRTDAVGSEEINLEVSQARAQAVINYWLGQGVNPDQIIADPRGEEGASDDDDAETAARQRRAEFIITGLLD
ncbi:MAG: OmpA family protein [Actinomycetota bacterium]